MAEELIQTLINQGFAVAVASYLLIRIEKKLDLIITAINGRSK